MTLGYQTRSGEEYDVTTRWRRLFRYTRRPGVCAGIKRGMRRRGRRYATQLIREQTK